MATTTAGKNEHCACIIEARGAQLCTPDVHISEFGNDVQCHVHIKADEDQECTPRMHISLIQEGEPKETTLFPKGNIASKYAASVASLTWENKITTEDITQDGTNATLTLILGKVTFKIHTQHAPLSSSTLHTRKMPTIGLFHINPNFIPRRPNQDSYDGSK